MFDVGGPDTERKVLVNAAAPAFAVFGLVTTAFTCWLLRDESAALVLGVGALFGIGTWIGVSDIAERRIPNRAVAILSAGTVVGLAVQALESGDWSVAVGALTAGLVAFVLAFALHLAGAGLGMGDVKLLFPICALLAIFGLPTVFLGIAISISAAAVAILPGVLAGRPGLALPLAPFLFLGSAIALVLELSD